MILSRNSKKGFTLIELLVVVAIIGLLSSIVSASVSSARAKSRDAKRALDVRQLKLAMEYYYDANGFYPSIGADGGGYAVSGLAIPLAPYIKEIPDDPLGGSFAWQYVRGAASANNYGLYIWHEKPEPDARCGSGVNFQTAPNGGWWAVGSSMCPF